MKLVHFQCIKCKAEFYVPTTPGLIQCPNTACQFMWAPHRASPGLSHGVIEEFQPITSVVYAKVLKHWTDSNPGFQDELIIEGIDIRDHPFVGAVKYEVKTIAQILNAGLKSQSSSG